MGQRLSLVINHDAVPIANAYYHWSAYTRAALDLLHQAMEYASKHPGLNPDQLAVLSLMETGAKPTQGELTAIAKILDTAEEEFIIATNRNDGLLAVTEAGMEETETFAEGVAELDLDRMRASCSLIYQYDSLEEICDSYDIEVDSEEAADYKNLQTYPEEIEVGDMSLEELGSLIVFLDELVGTHRQYVFQLPSGVFVEIIE